MDELMKAVTEKVLSHPDMSEVIENAVSECIEVLKPAIVASFKRTVKDSCFDEIVSEALYDDSTLQKFIRKQLTEQLKK